MYFIRLFKTDSSLTSKIQFVISIKKQRYLILDGVISILLNFNDRFDESSNLELEWKDYSSKFFFVEFS